MCCGILSPLPGAFSIPGPGLSVTLAEALPTHSQPRRARSRSKADVESLRADERGHPSHSQWEGVKEGQGGAALQVFSRVGSSYVHRCMYTCVHVHPCACGGQRTDKPTAPTAIPQVP